MAETFLVSGVFIICVLSIWFICSIACEYRNYSGGHRYIMAFHAKSRFQRFFALLQTDKDIDKWNVGKITYIGYITAIICTATAIFILPLSIVSFFINKDLAIWAFLYWFLGCFGLCLFCFVVQLLDSLLNYFIKRKTR